MDVGQECPFIYLVFKKGMLVYKTLLFIWQRSLNLTMHRYNSDKSD